MSDANPTPDPDRSGLDTRQRRLLFVVGIMLGAVVTVGVVMAAGGFLSNSVQANNVTLHAPNGPAVTFQINTSVNLTEPFPDNNTIEFRSAEGNITLSSQNRTNATVTQLTGTETRLEQLDVAQSNLTINPPDKPFVIVGQQADTLSFRDPNIADWTVDFAYSGPSGETYLVISGLPPNRKVKALDAATRVRLADDTTSGAGIAVFYLPNSGHSAIIRPAAYVSSNSSLPPYYNTTTPPGNLSGQVPKNATLDNLGQMIQDLQGFVIGFGDTIPGGNTYAGPLIAGLVMVGLFIGAVAFTGIGAAGGAVVASVAGYGLIEAGLAPPWMRVLLLFIIGAVASVALLRVTR